MEGKKMENHNPGVKCVVNTCHYYAQGDHCNAQTVQHSNQARECHKNLIFIYDINVQ